MVTRYIDFNRGSDSNDGSSPALAWKNLSKIGATGAAYGPGDSILLADDSVWEYDFTSRVVHPATWTGTRTNPVVIGKYSPLSASTSRPTISWHWKIPASAWTWDAPNNAWTCSTVATQGGLFLGRMCLVRLGGTWIASRNVSETQLPLSSIDGRFSATNATFYLYAPPNVDPTTYYGEVLIGAADSGFFSISTGRGFVEYNDLNFVNTSSGIFVYNTTATPNGAIIKRCSASKVSSIFRVMGDTASSTGASLVVQNCSIRDWGANGIWGFTTSTATLRELLISNNVFTNGGNNYAQGAVYLQAKCKPLGIIENNIISGAIFGTRDNAADGAGLYLETNTDNILIQKNIVYNTHCALQDNSGYTNTWRNNLVFDCKTAMKISDEQANNGVNCTVVNNTFIVGADVPAQFGPGDTGTGIRVFSPTGQVIPSLIIANNVILNKGPIAEAAILTAQVTPTVSSYTNLSTYNYTAVTKREYSGPADTVTDSITVDPQLDSFYQPRSTSPILGAGKFLGYLPDFYGKQRTTTPSIGAFELPNTRGAAGTRGTR